MECRCARHTFFSVQTVQSYGPWLWKIHKVKVYSFVRQSYFWPVLFKWHMLVLGILITVVIDLVFTISIGCKLICSMLTQVPTPDTYRGKYREDSISAGVLYANEVKLSIRKAMENGRTVSVHLFCLRCSVLYILTKTKL